MSTHLLIQNLNISLLAKQYFNALEFYEIIADPIIVGDPTHEVNEHLANKWSFAVDLKYCNENDILVFYQAIIDARRQYLSDNNIVIKMIFYTWYDALSGNFYFSIASQNSTKGKLPFGCNINKVDNIKIIIQNFTDDPYKGVIPLNEFIEITQSDDNEYDASERYILNVWSTIL